MNDIVSIVIPIYNMEKHIKKCVESIINQTYTNIEIILVNDGSTDDSKVVCQRIKEKYKNIYFIDKENGGVSTARNEGIKIARGKWIMFVDPDDYLEESIIERLLKNCTNNIDISICSCIAMENGKKNVCHFYENDRLFISFDEKKDLYKQLMKMDYGQPKGKVYTAIGVPWGKLYRLEFIKKNNIYFDENLRRVQDNIFNIEAFYKARGIKYIDEPLYVYNYEHMSTYFDEFKQNHEKIFTAVRISKYNCMKKLDLLRDNDLYSFYVNEAIIGEANIIKYGIFHKDNPESFLSKRKKVKKLIKNECFEMYMNKKGLKTINSTKYKMFWFMIKFKLFLLLYLASQMNWRKE